MMLRLSFFLFFSALFPLAFAEEDLNTVISYEEQKLEECQDLAAQIPSRSPNKPPAPPIRTQHTQRPLPPPRPPQAQGQPRPVQITHPTTNVNGGALPPLEGPLPVQPSSEILENCPNKMDGYTVNFDDICIIQLIKFVSQISDINFIYDTAELKDIKVTIVSEEPATVADLMGTLLQILRMRGFNVVEQGSNVIIHIDQGNVAGISTIITDDNLADACNSSVITRVFRTFNIMPDKVANVIKPLLSKNAIVEVLNETRSLVVSDITANVEKVGDLLKALDTPNSALDIGQYAVKASNPDVLVAYAKEILAPLTADSPVQIIPQPGMNKIFIVGSPYLIQRTMQILESLDSGEITEVMNLPPQAMANNIFYVYKLKYKNGQDIADAVHDIGVNLQYNGVGNEELVSAIYSIQWVDVNNSIVITGTQEAIDKVVALIEDLDVAPDQIYIEVLIIDTTLSNSLDFGVEWIALGNEQNKLAYGTGLVGPPISDMLTQGARTALNSGVPNAARPPPIGNLDVPMGAQFISGSPTDAAFGLGIIGNIIRHQGKSILTLGALVNALEGEGDTRIVLNPRIMTEDTREANFFVGQNIPYQTTSTIVRDTGSVTQNIQYEDIGIQLRVRPQVGPNRIVTLEIDQAISEVLEKSAPTQLGQVANQFVLAPTTTKTLATTRVHVPDGCFLVMSGHIRDQETDTRNGIPCLGTLPLIGPAFSTTSTSRSKRNLVMFIQPHLITNVHEGIQLTNQEGYNFNWESHPSSIIDCEPRRAPECETYPPLPCPCR
jgi:type III secretion protein C